MEANEHKWDAIDAQARERSRTHDEVNEMHGVSQSPCDQGRASKVFLRPLTPARDATMGLVGSPAAEYSAVWKCVLSVVGSLGCAGILLDYRGCVLLFNEMAQRGIGDGLMLRGERLTAVDHESDTQLQRLIKFALALTESPPAIMSMALQRVCKRPLFVRVLRLENNAGAALNSANVLIVTLDPEIYPEPPPDVLRQAFALTPTEAKVATGMISGRNLAEISSDLGVRAGTVRTHLKSAFSKTRTRGQAELVGLLTRVAFVTSQRLLPRSEGGQDVGQA